MAVIIKDFEIPECCAKCIFCDEVGDYPECIITETSKGYGYDIHSFRMPNCPLVPVGEEVLLPYWIKELYEKMPAQFDFVIKAIKDKKITAEEILKYEPKR